ncbi:MAG: hypothetical protein R3B13_35415 [Polyangiaceae bacterium]
MASSPPGSSASAHSWFESLGAYRWGFVAVILVALLAGSRVEAVRGPEASAVALGLPLVLGVIALLPFAHASRALQVLAGVATVVVVLAAELSIYPTVIAPAALSEADLTGVGETTTLDAPANGFRVEARAHLGKGTGSGEGRLLLEFTRAGASARVGGEVSKSASRVSGSRRRAPQQMGSHVIDTVREDVELAGSGPVTVRVLSESGAIGKQIHVSVLPEPPLGAQLPRALLVLAGLAVVVHAIAARVGVRTDFAALTAFGAIFAYYLPHHYAQSDPLGGVVGALLAALLLGGLGGWIAGWLLGRVLRPAEA